MLGWDYAKHRDLIYNMSHQTGINIEMCNFFCGVQIQIFSPDYDDFMSCSVDGHGEALHRWTMKYISRV